MNSERKGIRPPPTPEQKSILCMASLFSDPQSLSKEASLVLVDVGLGTVRDLPRSGRIFINFETHWHALAFRSAVHGVRSKELSATDHNGSMKPLLVEPAHRQGFFQNVGEWQRTLQGRNMPAARFPAVFIHAYRVNVFGLRTSMRGTNSSSSSSARP